MDMRLAAVDPTELEQYKADMQEAFQLGAAEGGYPMDGEELILPGSHIDRSLEQKNAMACKVVLNGEMAGGAIVAVDAEAQRGHLDFLYVKHGLQGKGVGRFLWFEIEKLYPEIRVWETCTPYFERRNIHFYINVCGFQAVEFFNAYHKDPHEPEEFCDGEDSGMFVFRKVLAG